MRKLFVLHTASRAEIVLVGEKGVVLLCSIDPFIIVTAVELTLLIQLELEPRRLFGSKKKTALGQNQLTW